MTLFIQQLINGLALGGIYCLAAVGLTLVFGVLGFPNLAHGALYMLGGYFTYAMLVDVGLPYVVAIVIAAAILAVIGIAFERLIFHPLRNAPHTHHMIATVGVMFFLISLVQEVWGTGFLRMDSPFGGRLTLGGAQISTQRIIIIVTAVIVLLALTWFLKRSVHGQAIEAVEQDRTGAALVGINPSVVSMVTFAVSFALVAISAGLVAPIQLLSPTMGESLNLIVFAIIILGGLGSLPGAIIGGFAIATAETMASTYISVAAGEAAIFVVLMAVLAIRPTGIFGTVEQR
ncbi:MULTISPECIES: branched-chain amino acid ABC transporter permease [Dietzia]|uniref:branched-chain amino acid ABC transporter permease n=1 Tax=Dietzia TaxID=37914 RepID=UPI001BCE85B3|nr:MULTISPECIES: branched-chain amino acid ABC transporter permease [Dietzia]MBS7548896.1 branched-chain amino acid ABC transporter permease [Dietzia massiliensis]USX45844.1 branched-chain amino acid ABC transporter permease [Dietzia kunjamensis]